LCQNPEGTNVLIEDYYYCAGDDVRFFFSGKFTLEDAIEFHAFAPLEAL
jgi:hypothetical protein